MGTSTRTPVWEYPDRYRVAKLAVIIGFDAAYGTLFLSGARAESASQVLLRDFLPIPLWGGILLVSAVAMWFGWAALGGVGATIAFGAQTIASAVTIVRGDAVSYGGPLIYLMLAGLHIVIVFGAASRQDLRTVDDWEHDRGPDA